MISKSIRTAGLRLIEDALSKSAFAPISAPSLASLRGAKTRELGTQSTASASVPKVLTVPTST